MDQIQHLEYRMIRFRKEGDEWQWLRRWTDGDLRSRRLHPYSFMTRIMNEVTTAGIHFQPGILGWKNPSKRFCVCVSSVVNMWGGFKGLWTRPWLRIPRGWASLPSGLGAGNAPPDPTQPFCHHSITPRPSRSHQSHLKDSFMIPKQVQIQKRIRKCLNLQRDPKSQRIIENRRKKRHLGSKHVCCSENFLRIWYLVSLAKTNSPINEFSGVSCFTAIFHQRKELLRGKLPESRKFLWTTAHPCPSPGSSLLSPA